MCSWSSPRYLVSAVVDGLTSIWTLAGSFEEETALPKGLKDWNKVAETNSDTSNQSEGASKEVDQAEESSSETGQSKQTSSKSGESQKDSSSKS